MNITRSFSLVLAVVASAGCVQKVGVGASQPVRLEPSPLDFGRLRPGSERSLELKLTNPARAMTNVELALEDDARHSFTLLSEAAVTVPAEGDVTVVVSFRAGLTTGIETAHVVARVKDAADVKSELRAEVASGADVCGDGVIGTSEVCDPIASCPSSCADDGNRCTQEVLSGAPATCDATCAHRPITACASDDGCCPLGCTTANDNDCSACGNGKLDPGEKCDPVGTCPTTCPKPNACTSGTLTGSAATCSAACTYAPITACTAGDGCCPSSCSPATDADCGVCGDGICQASETCEACRADCGQPPQPSTVVGICDFGVASVFQPPVACASEVIVVGVYQPSTHPNNGEQVVVNVNRRNPVTLVLSSYERVNWHVNIGPGAHIDRVIISGYADQVSNLLGIVPIEYYFPFTAPQGWLGCGYDAATPGNPGDCDVTRLLTAAERVTGGRVSLFLGCYSAESFTFD